MIQTYNYPGAQFFAHVQLADNTSATKRAASAWWEATHGQCGPCAPGGRSTLTLRDARAAKYRSGSHVYDLEVTAVVFAPGCVPPILPLAGWELAAGEGYVLHRPRL